VTSHLPGPRGRALIPLLVVLLGIVLGAGGLLLLHPFGTAGGSRPARPPGPAAHGRAITGPLHEQAVYRRLEPSVVDVTSILRYDAETAYGTGFIVDGRAALIITNNHVIRDATSVTARLTATGKTYPARIVGADVSADVAVLQLEGVSGLTAAPLGDSAAVALGMPVLAIGNQAGRGGSPAIAPGVIDAAGRTIQAADGTAGFTETLHDMLQTSAHIEPGDSGGPLADSAGMVIGMDTAAGTGASAVGYAIPINTAISIARQIAAGHAAPGITIGVGGFLGVVIPSTATASPRLQAQQEQNIRTGGGGSRRPHGCIDTVAGAGTPAAVAPARSGALVDGVLCGTGAATAGIAAGDVITAAAGRPVSSPDALTAFLSGCRPGTVVRVTWVSTAGVTRTSLIRLEVAPAV
jgi:S1-C subfamily serine protease